VLARSAAWRASRVPAAASSPARSASPYSPSAVRLQLNVLVVTMSDPAAK